jgi:hypothetical protein
MDLEAITPVHLIAFAERDRADNAVARACETASAFIARTWNERTGCWERAGKPRYERGYWETFPQAPRRERAADWGTVWWDWNLLSDDLSLPDSRGGVPVFISGAGDHLSNPPIAAGSASAGWAAPLFDTHGFVAFEAGYRRFVRVAYPEEVLVGRSLNDQGERLGSWIVESYWALYEAGPPPRAS